MFELVPFKKEHLLEIIDEPINIGEKDYFPFYLIHKLEETSVTLIYGDRVMVCGGITEYWAGRCQIWTMFSEQSKRHFVKTFRAIKRWVDSLPYRRIEISVDFGLGIGCRRAELLGFELECFRARGYLPDGRDAHLYSLVRD